MGDKALKYMSLSLAALSILFFYWAYKEHRPFAEARVKQEAVKEAAFVNEDPENPLDREIDFGGLKEINQDIIAWLYIPQIGVDHPIMKGKDDSEYLNLDFERNYSPLGSVFTWAEADERLTDPRICLFGHNMPSGQMFGRLGQFQDPEFLKANGTLYLYTPERSKELEIRSALECHMSDDLFQDAAGEPDRQEVTLATCTGYGATPYRLAVTCQVVREKIVL